MKVKVLKDCSYSADGFTIIELSKNQVLELDAELTEKFVFRGLVEICGAVNIEKELFNPVTDKAVIEPVEETKQVKKKRGRKKKTDNA